MINKETIKTLVEEWLQGNDYFLVDIMFGSDDRIVIEIDHADGVWIEDCAALSRFLQERLGEELGEFELEVGSILKEVNGREFVLTVKEKQTVEGKKRPVMVDVDKTYSMDTVKYAKYQLTFK